MKYVSVNFFPILTDRAKEACTNSGKVLADYFEDMLERSFGTRRKKRSYDLDRKYISNIKNETRQLELLQGLTGIRYVKDKTKYWIMRNSHYLIWLPGFHSL